MSNLEPLHVSTNAELPYDFLAEDQDHVTEKTENCHMQTADGLIVYEGMVHPNDGSVP